MTEPTESITVAASTEPAPLSPVPYRAFVLPILSILVGVAGLGFLAEIDTNDMEAAPWSSLIAVIAEQPPWDGMILFQSRLISLSNFDPDAQDVVRTPVLSFDRLVEPLTVSEKRERLLLTNIPVESMAELLDEGRVPVPGAGEVIAGHLCRFDAFSMDGRAYRVVGRIDRRIAALSFVYLLPSDPANDHAFANAQDVEFGFLDPNGEEKLERDEVEFPVDRSVTIIASRSFLPASMSIPSIVALTLVLFGGAAFQMRALRWLAAKTGLASGFVRDLDIHPRIAFTMHALNYGTFAGAMLLAVFMPVTGILVFQFVTDIFSEGSLKTLGDAYVSGDIPGAAWHTYFNNFVVQTLLMSIAASMIVPLFGVFKTLLSLAIAGFGIAPVWGGTIGLHTFHSVTVSLEVQAYTLASFGIGVFTLRIVNAIRNRQTENTEPGVSSGHNGIGGAFAVMLRVTIITAFILAIAAVYEAVTLIGLPV